MKPILKVIALLLLLMVIVIAIPLGFALLGRRSAEDGVEVNGVRIVKDGMVTVAVVPISPTTVALVDAGNDKAGTAILAELSRRGLDRDAVVAILLTHGHPDHTAATPLFPKADVIALDREAALIEGREGAHGPLPRWMPVSPTGVKVTHPVTDGETITIDQTTIRVFAVPGHTAGSAGYLVDGVLFLGDAGDADRNAQVEAAPWVFSDSTSEDRASLVSLSNRLVHDQTKVTAIAFAHSGVLIAGLNPLIAFARDNQ